ncbi:MAG: glycosyl hydrolase [Armatimonadetes bacterium]|nr:glycosyl hydrolase [Armatimonadota bacterium]
MLIDAALRPADLVPTIARLWEASAPKIAAIERRIGVGDASPVFTVDGKYTARGWTDWTQGFQFGSALLQFDATGDAEVLRLGRAGTLERMPPHITHFGVHDHGFNNVSTYGNLRRLILEGRIGDEDRAVCELALRCSGAVQARRWTRTADGGGFIHSFNGAHSLFVDTIRSLRALGMAHLLGQEMLDEQDERVSLLARLCDHLVATARWSVYYGAGRDAYDVRGRTAHESVFNAANGVYRCPSTQQGYSPFTTWTRGLAWAMCGFAQQLEFLDTPALSSQLSALSSADVLNTALRAAQATCDFYIANTPTDGVPYWDAGAPGLAYLGDWRLRPSEPFNEHEPVDSSAAAIAAQGMLRLGRYLDRSRTGAGATYTQAGLTIARALFAEPYLSTSSAHEGLILHSVYHRPNGWDHIPLGRQVPCGESSMWGDYHARELALLIGRLAGQGPYLTFFAADSRARGAERRVTLDAEEAN